MDTAYYGKVEPKLSIDKDGIYPILVRDNSATCVIRCRPSIFGSNEVIDFRLSAKTVADVNDVKTSLIRTRRIVFTPAQEVKDELKNTSVIITCYDREGNEVKRVTSADDGIVEDPENGTTDSTNSTDNGGSQNQGGQNGGGTGTVTPSGGDNGGGNSGGGGNSETGGQD